VDPPLLDESIGGRGIFIGQMPDSLVILVVVKEASDFRFQLADVPGLAHCYRVSEKVPLDLGR
jgi:hypothetical protein